MRVAVLTVVVACVLGCGQILGAPPEPLPENAGAPDAADLVDAGPVVPPGWVVLFDGAADVAVGDSDDAMWILEKPVQPDGNQRVLRWNPQTRGFDATPFTGSSLDATPTGPCVVKHDQGVWVAAGDHIAQLRGGLAIEIGAGRGGDVWVTSTTNADVPTNDKLLYRWTGGFGGNPFAQVVHGWGVRLDLGPDGSAWLVLDRGNVVRRIGEVASDVPLDGVARDIGVGANGAVYVVGAANDSTGALFEYSTESSRLEKVAAIDADRVSAGPSRVVAVLRDGRLVASF